MNKLDPRVVNGLFAVGMVIAICFRGDIGLLIAGLAVLIAGDVKITSTRTLSGMMAKVVGGILIIGAILTFILGNVFIVFGTLIIAILVGIVGLSVTSPSGDGYDDYGGDGGDYGGDGGGDGGDGGGD